MDQNRHDPLRYTSWRPSSTPDAASQPMTQMPVKLDTVARGSLEKLTRGLSLQHQADFTREELECACAKCCWHDESETRQL